MHGDSIPIESLSVQNDLLKGWTPQTRKDFLDIKFSQSLQLIKFVVIPQSGNLKGYTINLTDLDDVEFELTVIDDFSLRLSEHFELVKSMRFWPIKDLNSDATIRIKLQIFTCSGDKF